MKTRKTIPKKELCGAVIALARLVNKEAGGREICFVNEETKEKIEHDHNER